MLRFCLALTIATGLAGAAAAQEQRGDAAFCRSYAASTAAVAQDAIALHASCQDYSKGVHGDAKMHADWCARTPRSEVEGAATHIRRLSSRCTKGALAAPTEYGGYDIVGNERFERQYGQARGWLVFSGLSGRTLLYCQAVNPAERGMRIGRDVVEPGGSAQWQLAVPVKSRKDWQGTIEIDGRGAGNGGGSQISGTAVGDWTIAWLSMGDVEALRQGKTAVLGVGKADFDFTLDGAAAAMLMVEECVTRKGVPAQRTARADAGPAAAAEPSGANVPHPFDIQVTVSTKAQAKLRKIDEKVKVLAVYRGEPAPGREKLADEVGLISLGDEEAILPLNGGNARLNAELPRKTLALVKQPDLLINVSSAFKGFPDNLLDCELFDDHLEKAQQKGIEIHCKLIGE